MPTLSGRAYLFRLHTRDVAYFGSANSLWQWIQWVQSELSRKKFRSFNRAWRQVHRPISYIGQPNKSKSFRSLPNALNKKLPAKTSKPQATKMETSPNATASPTMDMFVLLKMCFRCSGFLEFDRPHARLIALGLRLIGILVTFYTIIAPLWFVASERAPFVEKAKSLQGAQSLGYVFSIHVIFTLYGTEFFRMMQMVEMQVLKRS